MTLSWHETWVSVTAVCIVGFIYLGGEALRDEFKISEKRPWRWGDAHRRNNKEATWGTHFVIAPVCLFITVLTIRLILRGF